MYKSITYTIFAIASIVVAVIFVTAKTYPQLAIGILLYPIIAFFGLKLFANKRLKEPLVTVMEQSVASKLKKVEVADIDKRAFLKMIGAAGISFFLLSFLNRRAGGLFFGKSLGGETVALQDSSGNKVDPSQTQPTDGYKISEIDDNAIAYFGFTKKGGSWFILREDTDAGSFRYVKGDSEFPSNWARRQKLKYDHYSNVF